MASSGTLRASVMVVRRGAVAVCRGEERVGGEVMWRELRLDLDLDLDFGLDPRPFFRRGDDGGDGEERMLEP
jgi:hypothetical protein